MSTLAIQHLLLGATSVRCRTTLTPAQQKTLLSVNARGSLKSRFFSGSLGRPGARVLPFLDAVDT